jgi:hypothetical protein
MMIKKLLPLLFLFAGFQVNAAAITSADVYDDGELEWLHASFTHGLSSSMSASTYLADGFRLASAAEARALMLGWVPDSHVSASNVWGGHLAQANAHIAKGLLDPNRADNNGSYFAVADHGLFGASTWSQNGWIMYGNLDKGVGVNGAMSTWAGYGMVRGGSEIEPEEQRVPEPTIIALFALGLVGIGFARRRQS